MASKYSHSNSPPTSEAALETENSSVSSSTGDWIVCGLLVAVAVAFLIGSTGFSDSVQRWPLMLSVAIVGLIALYATQQLLSRGSGSAAGTESGLEDELAQATGAGVSEHNVEEPATNERAVALAAVSFVIFAVIAYGSGFLLATIIFVPAYMIGLGKHRWLTVVGVTLGVTLVVYLPFGEVLNAPLTQGEWFGYRLPF